MATLLQHVGVFLCMWLTLATAQTNPEVEAAPANYLILAPNTIRPGLPLTLSVSIYKSQGAPVTLNAYILKGSDVVTMETRMLQTGTTTQVPVMIPSTALPGDNYNLQVLGSGGLQFNETRSLHFSVEHFSIFVQSDKAIYKPGQTVKFRVMAVYPSLRPYLGNFSMLSIADPDQNVIQQWLNLPTDKNGIISDEMVMSAHPVLGNWTIKAEAEGQMYEYKFQVDEYVLPKFEVTVKVPSFVDSSFTELPISVTARYTYGKPVEGSLSVTVGLRWSTPTITITNQNIDGTHVAHVTKSQLEGLRGGTLYDYQMIQVTASVTETLTGISQVGYGSLTYYTSPIKVEFSSSVSRANFKPGLPYQAYLLVTQQDGGPLTEEDRQRGLVVKACFTRCWGQDAEWVSKKYFISAGTGIVESYFETHVNATSMQLKAEYAAYNIIINKYLNPASSDSNTYIQVRAGSNTRLTVGSQAVFHIQSTIAPNNITYQVISRGNIIISDTLTGVTGTTYTLQLGVTAEMAPKSKLLVYFITSKGEVVLDSLEFVVDVVFENPVSVNFSRLEAQPGDSVNFDVTTTPGAFIGVLAVDKSVLLLATGNDITQDEVIQSLAKFDTTVDYGWGGSPFFEIQFCYFPYYTSGSTAGEVLDYAGVLVMTDADVKVQERHYYLEDEVVMFAAAPGMPEVAADGAQPQAPTTDNAVPEKDIRTEFPETWLWVDTMADSSGRASISTNFPDTITSWVGTAISMDPTTGLGVTKDPASATVLKKFFISLNLPYSVVRGEKFVLGATVFNYLDSDVKATVQLQSSKDYDILTYTSNRIEKTVTTHQSVDVTVPANGGFTVNFPMKPKKIGMIEITVTARTGLAQDGVRRFLLVEAEGVAQEYTTSELVDFSAITNGQYSKDFTIGLPAPDVVPDSVRTVVTATGDIMGPSMNGLDKLLQMPYGCGEQNMVAFAPDVFVYQYLAETGVSNPTIQEKALKFMKTGYQRELTYRHDDGSFSAFGKSDESGSLWLTAFVVRSFLQARNYIFIDSAVVEKALLWLISHQIGDGSFESVGKLWHKDLQGGATSKETRTAYVTLALHEAQSAEILSNTAKTQAQSAMNRATSYLAGRYRTIEEDKYAMAIITYTLALTGSPAAQTFRSRLDELATNEGNTRYWTRETQTVSPDSEEFFYICHRGPPPATVEMTSYALLAYLAMDDTASSVAVTKWLSQQRNAFGGYSSTQDTVIGLQALTTYALRLDSDNKNINMAITASDNTTYRQPFSVTNDNSVVYQQFEVPADTGTVTVAGSGQGSFLLTFILQYNLHNVQGNDAFTLDVDVRNAQRNSMELNCCGRYVGSSSGTGMAIMDVGLPSGFYVVEDHLAEAIQSSTYATRSEVSGQRVIIYLDEVPSDQSVCILLHAQRSKPVAETKPSVVRIYSYYKPGDQKVITYSSKALSDASVCDVCASCCPGGGAAVQSIPVSVALMLALSILTAVMTRFM